MKKFTALANLPTPMARKNYSKLSIKIKDAVKEVANETMQEATRELHNVEEKSLDGDIVDTSISCDGTWQKRGFTSLNGAVACLSMKTGRVIDVESMSRYCKVCVTNEKFKVTDPLKYETLMANHACKLNYQGSAPSMEMEGAKRIFNRSIAKYNLQYTKFFGDGDSKSFPSIENCYEGIKVIKQECIGHVQKRVGNRLRKLKKTVKGLGGQGQLTDRMIDRLQNYYGIAIRSNSGELKQMQDAVFAVLFHCASSKSQNFHNYCPQGKSSWCVYQRDKANGTNNYVPGPGLSMNVIKHVKPIFKDLGNAELLSKCLHGQTQNQNESFNAMIWKRIPKTTYVGLDQFELGVFDAVAHFNIGGKAAIRIYEKLGMSPGINTINGCQLLNIQRLNNAGRKTRETVKVRRRYLRGIRKSKGDKHKQAEKSTYSAGGF